MPPKNPSGAAPASNCSANRRRVVWALTLLALFAAASLSANDVYLQPRLEEGLYADFTPRGDIRRFAGETLRFEISFLWFENAASAEISFLEKDGEYYSILQAQTKGFVGWFTAYRKHVYKARFDITENGTRVRTHEFERLVIQGGDKETSFHHLDYNARKRYWKKTRNLEVTDENSEDIPEGVSYDDILAVFYNFRNSIYGELRKGAEFTIHTPPEKGHGAIGIQIKTEAEEQEFRTQTGRAPRDELLLNAIIPKDIFKTKTGQLLFWASKHYIPLETTVKDYLLLGDLHAKFVKREYTPPKPK